MRRKGKILSIVLSVMMVMQIFAITSFAAQAPTNVHWAKDGDPNKLSDAELVFNLVDGIDVYKITLYKDNQKIYTRISGYESDSGNFYEDLQDILNDNGPGSYTATVGTLSGTYRKHRQYYLQQNKKIKICFPRMLKISASGVLLFSII